MSYGLHPADATKAVAATQSRTREESFYNAKVIVDNQDVSLIINFDITFDPESNSSVIAFSRYVTQPSNSLFEMPTKSGNHSVAVNYLDKDKNIDKVYLLSEASIHSYDRACSVDNSGAYSDIENFIFTGTLSLPDIEEINE